MFGMTMLDQEFVQAIFHVTLNPDGLIKKQDDSVNFGGIMIPTRAYGNPEEMQEYLNRIENDREANFDRDLEKEEAFLGENGAFPPTRDGCIHSLSMRERG